MAKKYHPDRVGKDDKEAADKFKEVLSDPELRSNYGKDGRDGLSADKTSVADGMPQVDPSILFAFLFGSDQFQDYIGRLSTATSAMVGDSPKVSVATGRQIQHRRVVRLAVSLCTKIQKWVDEDYDLCKTMWKTEADKLVKASYGVQLVHLVGKVYNLTAVQFLGSIENVLGLPSISEWGAKKDKNSNKMEILRSGMTMMAMQAEYQQKMVDAKTDEEKKSLAEEVEAALSTTLLKILWTTTTLDITNTMYEVVQMVCFDQSVDKETRERRAHAIKNLGQVFMDCPDAPLGENEEEKDAKKLYEEAAFAAMLETIKKKDEAHQKTTGGGRH